MGDLKMVLRALALPVSPRQHDGQCPPCNYDITASHDQMIVFGNVFWWLPISKINGKAIGKSKVVPVLLLFHPPVFFSACLDLGCYTSPHSIHTLAHNPECLSTTSLHLHLSPVVKSGAELHLKWSGELKRDKNELFFWVPKREYLLCKPLV